MSKDTKELAVSYEVDGQKVTLTPSIDVALDEGKMNWSYIRGILRQRQRQGVTCLADWNRLELEREQTKRNETSPPAPKRKQYKTMIIEGEEVDVEVKDDGT